MFIEALAGIPGQELNAEGQQRREVQSASPSDGLLGLLALAAAAEDAQESSQAFAAPGGRPAAPAVPQPVRNHHKGQAATTTGSFQEQGTGLMGMLSSLQSSDTATMTAARLQAVVAKLKLPQAASFTGSSSSSSFAVPPHAAMSSIKESFARAALQQQHQQHQQQHHQQQHKHLRPAPSGRLNQADPMLHSSSSGGSDQTSLALKAAAHLQSLQVRLMP